MEKTHRLRWAEMRPSERRDAAVSFIGQVLKWAFVGAMCIFTLYPVIYTLLGSFKTNAELTLGGGILPEKWQIENYIYAFQKLEFGKYTLNSVVLALLTVLFTVTTASMAAYIIARREFPGKKLLTTSYLLSMFISVGSVALYVLQPFCPSWLMRYAALAYAAITEEVNSGLESSFRLYSIT